ncbi:MAG: anti-sigma factor [Thermoleophilia bacterium]
MSADLPDLRSLLPDDASDEDVEALRAVDGLLRSAPAPVEEVPDTLTAAVGRIPRRERPERRRGGAGGGRVVALRRRRTAALAIAAAIAGVAFAVGWFASGDSSRSDTRVEEVALAATPNGPPDGRMEVAVLAKDDAGNWPLLGQVQGLEPTGPGEYYELWLTKDRRVVLSCGRFTVDASGAAKDVWLNAPYKWSDYDDWVVTKEMPGQKPARSKWLLRVAIAGTQA